MGLEMPYVDVCKRLGVSFRKGHGLIRKGGTPLDWVKENFPENFDIVVDFDEELPPDAIPEGESDTIRLIDGDAPFTSGLTLVEWMNLYANTGVYLVALEHPFNTEATHVTLATTNSKMFFDTFDCSDWKVFAWLRIRKRASSTPVTS